MPKYKIIADEIRKKIINGEYEIGQKLPYEYVLCVTYHCNKETMKKALDILVKEGLIIRRRGAGTFVKSLTPFNNSSINSITRKKENDKIKSEVVEFEVVSANSNIASKLHIDEGDFIYHIIRNRIVNNKVKMVEITYIPINVIPNLKLSTLKGSLYAYIMNELNLKIQSYHLKITSSLSTSLEQSFLGLKEGEPYIEEEQISYLSSGVIFEYTVNRFHYKDFNFETTITS